MSPDAAEVVGVVACHDAVGDGVYEVFAVGVSGSRHGYRGDCDSDAVFCGADGFVDGVAYDFSGLLGGVEGVEDVLAVEDVYCFAVKIEFRERVLFERIVIGGSGGFRGVVVSCDVAGLVVSLTAGGDNYRPHGKQYNE